MGIFRSDFGLKSLLLFLKSLKANFDDLKVAFGSVNLNIELIVSDQRHC